METQSKFARRHDAEFKQNAVAPVQSVRNSSEAGRWVAAAKHGASQT
jgi:hypothetical protein